MPGPAPAAQRPPPRQQRRDARRARYRCAACGSGSPGHLAALLALLVLVLRVGSGHAQSAPVLGADTTDTKFARDNQAAGLVVATITASDADAGDTLTFSLPSPPANLPFTIGAVDGVLTTTEILDSEIDSLFVFLVAVSDGTFTATANVTVVVLGVSQNPPVLGADTTVTKFVQDNQAAGLVVATITASDPDAGETLQFSLPSPPANLPFSIGALDGVLETTEVLDREIDSLFVFLVAVSDGTFTATANITVVVLGVSQSPPVLGADTTDTKFVRENQAAGTVVATITASDPDAGETLQFSLPSPPANLPFSIGALDGVLTTTSPLDREIDTSFVFLVAVSDGTFTDTANVTVVILGLLQAPPVFAANTSDPVTVRDNQAAGALVTTVIASDVNADETLTFSLPAPPANLPFSITVDGVLTTTEILDSEIDTSFVFLVAVTDGTFSVTANVTVLVVRLTAPVLGADTTDIKFVPENLAAGAVVTTVSASDVDVGDTLTFSLPSPPANLPFSIGAATGVLVTTEMLDREQIEVYTFGVAVTDATFTTTATMIVVVVDANDNAPVVSVDPAVAVVLENTSPGVIIAMANASDLDVGPNDDLAFSLGAPDPRFAIDARTGAISLLQALDREAPGQSSSLSLLVVATDDGDIPLRGTATLNVTVADVNDNAPAFPANLLAATVGEAAAPNDLVLLLNASDLDAGGNAVLTFNITAASPAAGHFAVDASGALRVAAPLDREAIERYTLVVEARDGGSPSLAALVQVTVVVVDANDNPPTLLIDNRVLSLAENAGAGVELTALAVLDPDAGANARSEVVVSDPRFAIVTAAGNATGLRLVANASFDREATPVVPLNITARNTAPPFFSATANLTVLITDVNDNAPTLAPPTAFSIAENVGPAVLGTLVAMDPDEGVNGAVSFLLRSNALPFALDPTTGVLRLTAASGLDFEAAQAVDLEVDLVDGGSPPLTTRETVQVQVIDANDNAPVVVFSGPLAVPESANRTNLRVGQVLVADPDSGAGGMVTFSLGPGNATAAPFRIDPATGELFTTAPLDREQTPSHAIEVVATDGGSPALETRFPVDITVLDINDKSPVFARQGQFTFVVREDSLVGAPVGTLSASDADEGTNAAIEFGIVPPGGGAGVAFGPFVLDVATGVLTLGAALDFEQQASFEFNVSAANPLGSPQLPPVPALVRVDVVNVNDEVPVVDLQGLGLGRSSNFSGVFVEEGPGVPIAASTAALLDGDGLGRLASVTVSLVARPDGLEEGLLVSAASGAGPAPTLSFSMADLATLEAQLRAVRYANLADEPDPTSRLVSVLADDGLLTTVAFAEFAITLVNDAPELTVQRDTLAFVEGQAALQAFAAAGLLVSDDDSNLASLNVTFAARPDGAADALGCGSAIPPSVVCTPVSDGVQLQPASPGGAPPQDLTAAARSLEYTNQLQNSATSGTPRELCALAADTSSAPSNPACVAINYTAVNDPPILLNGAAQPYTENSGFQALLAPLVEVLDIDSATLLSVAVEVVNPGVGEALRTLPLANVSLLGGSTGPSPVLEFVGPAAPQGFTDALRAIEYGIEALFEPLATQRLINVTVTDAEMAAAVFTIPLAVTLVNDAPILDLGNTTAPLTFVENQLAPLPLVDPAVLRLEDPDNAALGLLFVTLNGVRDGAGETVAHSNVFQPLVSTFGSATILSFSFSPPEPISVVRALIESLAYANPAAEPTSGLRTITIQVQDSSLFNAVQQLVTVNVANINDNAPAFVNVPPQRLIASEAEVVGGTLATLLAQDADAGVQGVVTHRLASVTRRPFDPSAVPFASPFAIDAGLGSLSLALPLDRESAGEYLLTVKAADGGSPPREVTTLLTIIVCDVNDNPPAFAEPTLSVDVLEDAPVMTALLQVTAADLDAGLNAGLGYTIVEVNGSPGSTAPFAINNATGELTLAGRLDREFTARYEVVVQATDGFPPQLAAAEGVDCTFLEPTFTALLLDGSLSTGTLVGFESVQALALDIINALALNDPGLSFVSVAEYASTSAAVPASGSFVDAGNDMAGVLVAGVEALNASGGRHRPSVALQLAEGTLFAGPPTSSFVAGSPAAAVLVVQSAFDEVAADFAAAAARLRGQGIDLYVAAVGTFDGAALAGFAALTGNASRVLAFPGPAGAAAAFLPQTLCPSAGPASVCPGVQPQLSATVAIDVQVLDVNDNPPVFSGTFACGFGFCLAESVSEALATGSPIVVLSALDADLNQTLRFSLDSGNAAGLFALDPASGLLELAQPLDAEAALEHSLVVRVSDGTFADRVQLNLSVADENDNAPQFLNLPATIDLDEGPARPLGFQAQAADADATAPNRQLSFRLASDLGAFAIDAQTGAVSSTRALDFEAADRLFTLTVVVTDGTFEESAALAVAVVDVNDNAPVLDQLAIAVSEAALVGEAVFVFSASDADAASNAAVDFVSLVPVTPPGLAFLSVSASGVLRPTAPLDAELFARLAFNLTVRDRGTPPLATSSTVEVAVLDANDNPPVFTIPLALALTANESTPVGTVLATYAATDADITNNTVQFRLAALGGNPAAATDVLRLDAVTGELIVTAPLDRERQAQLPFTAVATDAGAPPLSTTSPNITLTVLDINDNAPVFSQFEYAGMVAEDAGASTLVVTVDAEDRDAGLNGAVAFAIVSGNGAGLFAIDAATGAIVVNGALDREADAQHFLRVSATDGGQPAMSSVALVTITVLDVNDNPPVFACAASGAFCYEANFTEGTTNPNVNSLFVLARSADAGANANITYSLAAGPSSSLFVIGQSSGTLVVGGQLDRESQATHTLTVIATDGGVPPLSASAAVLITVLDINDNAPVFQNLPARFEVAENLPAGTVVATLTATDFDAGANGAVVISASGTDAVEVVGTELRTTRPLDREQLASASVTLTARDMGSPVPLETVAVVELAVLDVDDNQPVFAPPLSVDLAVLEGPVVAGAAPLFTVAASDADDAANARFVFTLVSSSVPGAVAVDSQTGAVRQAAVLDRELVGTITLVIDTIPPAAAPVSARLVLADANDNAPVFALAEVFVTIAEDAVGVLQTVAAVDLDVGTNAEVSYAIAEVVPASVQGVVVDPLSGVVSLLQPVDFEAVPRFEVVVRAQDGGAPPLSSNASLVVTVTDVNDNAPLIAVLAQNAVEENSLPGQEVARLRASDRDSGGNAALAVALLEGSPRFALDAAGTLRVASPVMDLLDPRIHDSSVPTNAEGGFVFDGASLLRLTSFNQSVGPAFSIAATVQLNPGASGYILSKAPQISLQFFGLFVDGVRNFVRFFYRTGGSLTVHVVNFVARIDDGAAHQLLLSVSNQQATLIVDGAARGTAMLVGDVDDCGLPAPDCILSIGARPLFDRGLSFLTGTVLQVWLFPFEALSAHPPNTTVTDNFLDFEAEPRPRLVVAATDRGSPPLTTNLTLPVQLLDVNDNRPVFVLETFEFPIQEETAGLVGTVFASDADSGQNANVTYRIVGGDPFGLFTLSATGVLSTRGIDRELLPVAVLEVEARDQGVPSLSASTTVTVPILDRNDNAPLFRGTPYAVTLPEDAAVGATIFTPVVFDPDAASNGELAFAVSGAAGRVAVNATSGAVALAVQLDFELLARFTFTLVATDGGSPQLSASTLVTVEVQDLNDNAPFFGAARFEVDVSEDALLGVTVLTAFARDFDNGANAAVAYALDIGGVPAGCDVSLLDPCLFAPESRGVFALQAGGLVLSGAQPVVLRDASALEAGVTATSGVSLFLRFTQAAGTSAELVTRSHADGRRAYSLQSSSAGVLFFVGNNLARFPVAVNTGAPRSVLLVVAATTATLFVDGVLVRQDASFGRQFGDCVAGSGCVTQVGVGLVGSVERAQLLDAPAPAAVPVCDRALLPDFLACDDARVVTAQALDREAVPAYNLTLTAEDGGRPPLSGTTRVAISLIDVNDNTPAFVGGAARALNVSEAAAVGAVVVTLEAADPDAGLAGTVRYSLRVPSALFAVDAVTGAITVAAALDFETGARQESVLVRADDLGTPPRSTLVRLDISVLDANDNPPVFRNAVGGVLLPSPSLAEDVAVGTPIFRALATDADQTAGGPIVYSLLKSSPATDVLFAVGSSTGTVTVAAPLDFEAAGSHTLDISASDGRFNTTARLIVAVTNINDNAPLFNASRVAVSVSEGLPAGAEVFVAVATDGDLDSPGEVTVLGYEIAMQTTRGVFVIPDAAAGVVALGPAPLDREFVAAHTVVVRVWDRGVGSGLFSEQTLDITVLDENDNRPLFARAAFAFAVAEGVAVGTEVGRVAALDPDAGTNAQLTFSIASASPPGLLAITAAGVLESVAALDFEAVQLINLTVAVRDGGSPSLSDTATVRVQITDLNDNLPQIDPGTGLVSVPEDAAVGSVAFLLTATDLDSGSAGAVTFALVQGPSSGSSPFAVQPDGRVLVANALDFEVEQSFTLVVSAMDQGPGAVPVNQTVLVRVVDVNDNPAALANVPSLVRVFESQRSVVLAPAAQLSDLDSFGTLDGASFELQGGSNQTAPCAEPTDLLAQSFACDPAVPDAVGVVETLVVVAAGGASNASRLADGSVQLGSGLVTASAVAPALPGDAFSLIAWLRLDGPGRRGTLLSKQGSFTLELTPTDILFRYRQDAPAGQDAVQLSFPYAAGALVGPAASSAFVRLALTVDFPFCELTLGGGSSTAPGTVILPSMSTHVSLFTGRTQVVNGVAVPMPARLVDTPAQFGVGSAGGLLSATYFSVVVLPFLPSAVYLDCLQATCREGLVLPLPAPSGLAFSYGPAQHVVTVTGTASLAQYTELARALRYSNQVGEPAAGGRVVAMEVVDGPFVAAARTTLQLELQNDNAPVLASPVGNDDVVFLDSLTAGLTVLDQTTLSDADADAVIFGATLALQGAAAGCFDGLADPEGCGVADGILLLGAIPSNPAIPATVLDIQDGLPQTVVAAQSVPAGIASAFAVSVGVRPAANASGYLWAKTSTDGQTRFYALFHAAVSNRLLFYYRRADVAATGRASRVEMEFLLPSGLELDDGRFHTVQLSVEGARIAVFVDGVPVLPRLATFLSAAGATQQLVTDVLPFPAADGDGPFFVGARSPGRFGITAQFSFLTLLGEGCLLPCGEELQLPAPPAALTASAVGGVLTLSGRAPLAVYEAALRRVVYLNAFRQVAASQRAVTAIVSDGVFSSNLLTVPFAVENSNDFAPRLDLDAADDSRLPNSSLAFLEMGLGQNIAPGAVIRDDDGASLPLARTDCQVLSPPDGAAEQLVLEAGFSATGLTAVRTGDGAVSLVGPVSVAVMQTALRALQYLNTANEPNFAARTIACRVHDGAFDSNTAFAHVSIVPVNDGPVVAVDPPALNGAVTYVEDQQPLAVAPTADIIDPDSSALVNLTVALLNRPDGAQESLALASALPAALASVSDGRGGLIITGVAGPADYRTAVRAITYGNRAMDPSTALRTVSFVAHDGLDAGAPTLAHISFVSVPDAPVIDLNGPGAAGLNFSATFVEDGFPVGLSALNTVLMDVDSDFGDLVAELVETDSLAEDMLFALVGSAIQTGTSFRFRNLSFPDLAARATTVLFSTTAQDPSPAVRVVRFTLSDTDGLNATAFALVSVTAVNDAPVLSLPRPQTETFVEQAGPVAVLRPERGLALADADDDRFAAVVVTLGRVLDVASEVVDAATNPGPTVSPVSATSLAFTFNLTAGGGGGATRAEVLALLAALRYNNTEDEPTPGERLVLLNVLDASGGETGALSAANIDVQLVNDNFPAFLGEPFQFEVAENAPAALVAVVVARDGDGDPVTYTLVPPTPPGLFSLDPRFGILTTVGGLDREVAAEQLLTVQASDGLLDTTAVVRVTVRDENDNTPVFAQPVFHFAVLENAPPGTPVGTLVASDLDVGANAALLFSLASGAGRFALNATSGGLSTLVAFDHEVDREAMLVATVTDQGSPALASDATVVVSVLNVNDVAPAVDAGPCPAGRAFPAQFCIGPLAALEESVAPVVVGQLTARDADNDTVTFVVLNRTADGVSVDPLTGEVAVLGVDREIHPTVELLVVASDGLFTSAPVSVEVALLDINDNTPSVALPATAAFRESSPAGTVVVTAVGADPDAGANAALSFRLLNDFRGRFAVNASTGAIALGSTLFLRSEVEEYVLTVEATDGGAPPLSAQATVTVRVVDAADVHLLSNAAPEVLLGGTTSETNATRTFVEGQGAVLAASAARVFDTDSVLLDSGSVRIVNGVTAHETLTVPAGLLTGLRITRVSAIELALAGPSPVVEWERVFSSVSYDNSAFKPASVQPGRAPLIAFEVLDGDGASTTSFARVALQDVNQPPQIDVLPVGLPFVDGGPCVQLVAAANASDRDGTAVRSLVVELAGGGAADAGLESVELAPGAAASVVGGAPTVTSGAASGVVSFNFTFAPGPVGFATAEVAAAALRYCNAAVEPSGASRAVGIRLDDGLDTGPAAELTLAIVRVADEAPVFAEGVVNITLTETNSAAGVDLLFVARASDADIGPGSGIVYSIKANSLDGALVTVDASSGEVRVVAPLDREALPGTLSFVVVASNAETPGAVAEQLVVVTLLDVNDNAPVFVGPPPSVVTVTEGRAAGVALVVAQAADADATAPNSAITYSLLGNTAGLVSIDAGTGAVETAAVLDREAVASFQITVVATDGGVPALTAQHVLTVQVADINDNPPMFDAALLAVQVAENTAVGTTILNLSSMVVDPDAGNNGTLSFGIRSATTPGLFSLGASSGLLAVAGAIDFEVVTSVTLLVSASDGGSPPTFGATRVEVTILNLNDNAPTILNGARVAVVVPEDAAIGTVAVQLAAVDADDGSGSSATAVTFALAGGQAGALPFAVGVGGDVRVATALDREAVASVAFIVEASDGTLSSTIEVEVTVGDVNEHPPTLLLDTPRADFATTFTEDNGAVPVVRPGRLTVTDADPDSLVICTILVVGTVASDQDVVAVDTALAATLGVGVAAGTAPKGLRLGGAGVSPEALQSVLRTVTYNSADNNAVAASRSITFVVSDGLFASQTRTATVTIATQNDAPVVSASGLAAVTWDQASGLAVAVFGSPAVVQVVDLDSATLASAEVALANGEADDTLQVDLTGTGLSGAFDAATAVLTIQGPASPATYAAVLAAVTFDNSAAAGAPSATPRTVSALVSDGAATSQAIANTVNLAIVNTAPEIDLNGANVAGVDFEAALDAAGEALLASAALAFVDDAEQACLTSLTATIVEGGSPLEGLFAETIGTGLTLQFDQASGTLTLSNCRPPSEYTSVLRTIRYFNDGTPAATRQVRLEVSDGIATAAATATVVAAA